MVKKKSNNTLLIILIVIAVILVISLILYFFLFKENFKKKKGGKKKGGKKKKTKKQQDNKKDKKLVSIKFDDEARKCMGTGTWIVDPKDPSKNRCVKDKKVDTSKLIQNKYYTETNPIEYDWSKLPYPWNETYKKKFNTGGSLSLSPNGKKIFFYMDPTIQCGSVIHNGIITTLEQSKKTDANGLRTPFIPTSPPYGIIGIYDINKERIIDTIQDIGTVNAIVSNYDGSVISFFSKKGWKQVSKTILETQCLFQTDTIPKILTYKLNPITSKYEPFTEPLIVKTENPGMTTFGGYSNVRRVEVKENPYDWPDEFYMSYDNQKLIVDYTSFVNIYNLIDNKWQLTHAFPKEIFAEEVPSYMASKYTYLHRPELKGVSTDFKTILLFNWRIGKALVFRLNEENNKYEQIGNYLSSGFEKNPTAFTSYKFRNGAIDQTGNRLAFGVNKKDVVFIYNYNQDQDQWIKTQEILPKIKNKDEDIQFGEICVFGNQGKELFVTGIYPKNFINIYKLDSSDNQYKFFDMLTPQNKNWGNFGYYDPKISQDGNTIVVGSKPNLYFNIPGGISLYKRK